MTKRTAYEDMVKALEASKLALNLLVFKDRAPVEWPHVERVAEAEALADAALTTAKKVPVEVGMFGTGSQEDVIYQRIFMSGKTRAEDVEVVKSATKGHPPNHTCWACGCLRELESREAL